jgi:hypothetical protein
MGNCANGRENRKDKMRRGSESQEGREKKHTITMPAY